MKLTSSVFFWLSNIKSREPFENMSKTRSVFLLVCSSLSTSGTGWVFFFHVTAFSLRRLPGVFSKKAVLDLATKFFGMVKAGLHWLY